MFSQRELVKQVTLHLDSGVCRSSREEEQARGRAGRSSGRCADEAAAEGSRCGGRAGTEWVTERGRDRLPASCR